MDPKRHKWYDQQYMYFRNADGKVQRYKIAEYKSKPGRIRLKWLEKPYLWWKFQAFDTRNAMIPIFISMVTSAVIFNLTMLGSQREAEMEGAARIPEEFSYENIEKYARQREKEEMQERVG